MEKNPYLDPPYSDPVLVPHLDRATYHPQAELGEFGNQGRIRPELKAQTHP